VVESVLSQFRKNPKTVEGVVKPRQRLILDRRAVNLMFKEPPYTQLGSLAAELELGPQETLFTAGCDIQGCFYAAKMPEGLEQFFCLHQNLSADEVYRVFRDDVDLDRFSGVYVPCVNVLPIVFSWSFYIIQQLHEQAAMRALNSDDSRLIKDGRPAPPISGESLAMPYCDNVHCMATSQEEAELGKQKISHELDQMGFTLHEDEESKEYFQTLGGVIDGSRGVIIPTPARAWNCILAAFEFLLHHRVSPKLVQQLVGHSVVISVLNGQACLFLDICTISSRRASVAILTPVRRGRFTSLLAWYHC
jgi:hypothetical protein